MEKQKIAKPTLMPTADQTFEIEGQGPWNFHRALQQARRLQEEGKMEQACRERYHAVQRLLDLLPEEEMLALEWNHANTRAGMELLYLSMIDHFLIGDLELSAALGECLLDCDPEDHLEATTHLAFIYLAMQEFDSFEELLPDLSEKDPERPLLLLWASWMQHGELDRAALSLLKSRFAPWYEEFRCEEHPADEAFLRDISSERPSASARARELWLKTENLWMQHPDFVEALRKN